MRCSKQTRPSTPRDYQPSSSYVVNISTSTLHLLLSSLIIPESEARQLTPWECKMRAEVAIGDGGVVRREEMKLLTASSYRCHDNHTGGDLGRHLPLSFHSTLSRPTTISLLRISSQSKTTVYGHDHAKWTTLSERADVGVTRNVSINEQAKTNSCTLFYVEDKKCKAGDRGGKL